MAVVDSPPQPDIISLTTVLSLSAVLTLFLIAYTCSRVFLPTASSSKTRTFFIWHAFDALVHFSLEGSFLYNCFFTSLPIETITSLTSPFLPFQKLPFTPPEVFFLGRRDVLHGAFYGQGVTAKLWQEYAHADRRWGGTDLTVISLELLTVFVMGPLAVYVCTLLARGRSGPAHFWMIFIATGELYGGFMTFAPEWLSGSPNLDTSNFMYKWVYLVFMNTLWVFIPGWILWEAYLQMADVFESPAKTLRSGKKVR